ncbi:unnamed protein product [Periconia digitata]|uniref:Glycosyltransferase family 20 protein n=1 Tax=Periconia digitata TaxID=1303443 RepID=A0A9W4UV30_9PLEO|nr:unnamed protein product [Periconia digitata]
MTTFVVSLFLPYTIDFQDPDAEQTPAPSAAADAQPAPSAPTSVASAIPPLLAEAGKNVSSANAPTTKATADSLLRDQRPTHINLPAVPEQAATDSYFPITPAPTNPASHFIRPTDPRSLVRSDAHVAEFGGSSALFNQPRSRADPVPPNNIFESAKAQEKAKVERERASHAAPPKSKYRGKAGGLRDPRWEQPWTVVPAVQGNGGLSNAINASVEHGTMKDVMTVGTVGFSTDALVEHKKVEIHDKLLEDHKALAVFISDKDSDGHYGHYCKTILWPVFHYVIPDHPKSKAFLDHSWVYYESVNRAFADKVIKAYKRGDVIWIHDYHLCLVPDMIRKALPDAKIGFFLHTAFPSSEVFRCLAARKELLTGMLGANLVAFQTREYAHHFLQTCSRILGVEAVEDGVQLENRFVNVSDSPIGIAPRLLHNARQDAEVKEWIDILTKRYKGKHLIVARDKLDSIRGVRQKLLAFELFLKKNPEWIEKVVLIQVATSAHDDLELATTVSDIVERIDAAYSTITHNPLVFLRQDIPFSQYLALLTVADALAITSLREGMNLTCHEFVACQDGAMGPKKHGPVILSEFTGSAAIFKNAEISVNPWNYQGIADGFKQALEMTGEEKKRRWDSMNEYILYQTGDYWMTNLVDHLTRVFDEQFSRDAMTIPRLSTSDTIARYESTWSRLFLLDYEGTLASYGAVQRTVLTGNDRILNVLNELLLDDKNVIYIMSGRTVEELELLFDRVPGVGLIAENGCFIREPKATEWKRFPDEQKTARWMSAIKQILQYYIERIEGSYIEEHGCSMIYHLPKSKDNASQQAGECANHINDGTESQNVKAIPTKNSVIIEPSDFDKATAAEFIWSKYHEVDRPEFVFVAGNDRDDETVLKWAKNIKDNWWAREVITVTVGDRNSSALATVTNGSTGLLTALQRIARVRTP